MDIKEDNILVMEDVSADEVTQKHIKLCDFGLCTIATTPEGSIEESGMVGTKGYFAPEMAGDYDYDARAADMWSIGCMLLNLVDKVPKEWREIYGLYKTRKDCFQRRLRVLTMMLHCDDDHFQGTILPVVQIIRGLLKMEPGRRLTAAEVLRHPWLAE
jgi:calcium-dependent protein kinase